VCLVARQLLGKQLVTRFRGAIRTAGLIVETEAYAGPEDRASHAYGSRRTARTEVMFHDGGTAYVYLCYGMHALFNVVTSVVDVPHAILIRAVEPTIGIPSMLRRRGHVALTPSLTAGPGVLTQALGIDVSHSGCDLCAGPIRIEDVGVRIEDDRIQASPRVGVAYAGPHARRPWRFRIRDNRWTSKAR